MGKNHPGTLIVVVNIASAYMDGLMDYGKAEELFQRVLEGFEAQHGKDHMRTRACVHKFYLCLCTINNMERLEQLVPSYPWLRGGVCKGERTV